MTRVGRLAMIVAVMLAWALASPVLAADAPSVVSQVDPATNAPASSGAVESPAAEGIPVVVELALLLALLSIVAGFARWAYQARSEPPQFDW